jgi:hypothetical protein
MYGVHDIQLPKLNVGFDIVQRRGWLERLSAYFELVNVDIDGTLTYEEKITVATQYLCRHYRNQWAQHLESSAPGKRRHLQTTWKAFVD